MQICIFKLFCWTFKRFVECGTLAKDISFFEDILCILRKTRQQLLVVYKWQRQTVKEHQNREGWQKECRNFELHSCAERYHLMIQLAVYCVGVLRFEDLHLISVLKDDINFCISRFCAWTMASATVNCCRDLLKCKVTCSIFLDSLGCWLDCIVPCKPVTRVKGSFEAVSVACGLEMEVSLDTSMGCSWQFHWGDRAIGMFPIVLLLRNSIKLSFVPTRTSKILNIKFPRANKAARYLTSLNKAKKIPQKAKVRLFTSLLLKSNWIIYCWIYKLNNW